MVFSIVPIGAAGTTLTLGPVEELLEELLPLFTDLGCGLLAGEGLLGLLAGTAVSAGAGVASLGGFLGIAVSVDAFTILFQNLRLGGGSSLHGTVVGFGSALFASARTFAAPNCCCKNWARAGGGGIGLAFPVDFAKTREFGQVGYGVGSPRHPFHGAFFSS